ncbi:hypothetical protein CHS0354_033984 [Potamilus streckersoni]|uniref:GRIP domain-containing protein n=1 Tax=Potamilus streckersoni TaxID=2493646 RepID=A0AAE0T8J8_9BIVA|nr:hypothetical protein CHS0354_033984 [Potamilus streckersoni]
MSETSGDGDGSPGPGKSHTPSKLDNLSREDLVKFVKKQILTVQKLKAQNDELSKKVSDLETSGNSSSKEKALEERVEELECQNKELQMAYTSLQQGQEMSLMHCQKLEAQCKSLTEQKEKAEKQGVKAINQSKALIEQVDCMKMKDETLSSSFHCLQQEQNKIAAENKDLKEQVALLTEARDQMMENLKVLKRPLEEKIDGAHLDRSYLIQENRQLQQQIQKLEAELQDFNSSLKSTHQESETQRSSIEGYKANIQQLEENLKSIKEENEAFREAFTRLQESYQDIEEQNQSLRSEKVKINKECENCKKSQVDLHHQVEEMKSVLKASQQERDQFLTSNKTLKESLTAIQEQLNEQKMKMEESAQTYNALQKELKVARNSLSGEVEKNGILQSVLSEAQQQVKQLSSREKDLNVCIDELKLKSQKLEEKIVELTGDQGGQETKLQGVIEELQKENHSLEVQLSQAVEAKENLGYEMNELHEEKEILRNEIQKKEQQMNEWEHLMQILTEDKERVLQELDKSDHNEHKLRHELEEVLSIFGESVREKDRKERKSTFDDDDVFMKKEVQDDEENSLVSHVTHIKTLISNLITQKNSLIQDLQSSNDSNSVELKSLRAKYNYALEAKEGVEREKDSQTVLLQIAQDKSEFLLEENSTLKADLENMGKEKSALIETINSLQQKIHGFEDGNENYEREIEKYRKLVSDHEAQLKDKLNYTQEIETKVIDLSNALSDAKRKYDSLKSDVEANDTSASKILEAELTELKQKVDGLENDKMKLNNDLSQMRRQNEQVSEQCVLLETEKVRGLEKLAQLESKLRGITLQLEESQSKIELSEEECGMLKTENWKYRSQIYEQIETITELTKQKNDLEETLEDLQIELSRLKSDKEDMKTQHEKLKIHIMELNEKEKSMVIEINELKKSLEELQGLKYEMEKELENSKVEINELRHNKETLEVDRTRLLEDINSLVTERNNLADQLKSSEEKINNIESEKTEVFLELQNKLSAKKELEMKLLESERLAATRMNEIEEKSSLICEMEEKYQDIVSQLNERHCDFDCTNACQSEPKIQFEESEEINKEKEKELGEMKQSIDELGTKIKEMEGEKLTSHDVLKLKEETERHLIDQVKVLEETYKNLEEENLLIQNEVKQKRNIEVKLTDQINELEEKLRSLEEEKFMVQSEIQQKADTEDKLMCQIKDFEEKLKILEDEKLAAQNHARQKEETEMRLTEKIKEYEEKYKSLQTEMLNTPMSEPAYAESETMEKVRVDELMAENKSRFDSLGTEYCSQIRQLQCQIERLQDELKVKDEKLVAIEVDATRVQFQNSQLSSHIHELKSVEMEKLQKSEASDGELQKVQNTLKEREEMCNKLKTLAVKTKKDLADLKTKFDAASEELKKSRAETVSLQQQVESLNSQLDDKQNANLQEQFDTLLKELEKEHQTAEAYKADLEKTIQQLTELKGNLDNNKEEKDKLNRQIQQLIGQVKVQEGEIGELRTMLKTLEQERDANRIQKEEIQKEKLQGENKLKEMEGKLRNEEEKHKAVITGLQEQSQALQKELESARQEATQSSMMDLEIADYERTVQALNGRIADRDKTISELRLEINRLEERAKVLQEQAGSIEEQRLQAEDRGNKLKQFLVKTKKDLADAKKWETEQRTSDAQMRGQIEHLTQQTEEYKVQIATIEARRHKVEEKLRSISDGNQRNIKSLEAKVQALQGDLDIARSELTTVQAEYEGYKVRVHSVLKQQKSKSQSEVTVDAGKQERERLERAVEQLQTKLKETRELLSANQQENMSLQEEQDRLLQRQNKLFQDQQDREDNFRRRLEEMAKEKADAVRAQQEIIQQLKLQNATVSASFRDQIIALQEDHHHSMEMLQKRIDHLESENLGLERELQQQAQYAGTKSSEMEKSATSLLSELQLSIPDIRHMERQEGEGSELVDPEPYPRVTLVQKPSLVPLGELLNSEQMDQNYRESDKDAEIEMLKKQLLTANKKIEHLTEVMNDSEATLMRLTEQAKILKEEIRRLERNTEREQETRNLEYLKNILLKFLTLKQGDERHQLIPVLTTMLKLSPSEKDQLMSVAQGEEGGATSQLPGGWGSYLHRWSGLT